MHLCFSLQLRAATCCQKSFRSLRRGPVLLNIFHYLLFVQFLFCIIFQINACALSRMVLRLGFGGKVGEAAGHVVVEPLLLVALAVRARDPSTPSLNRYGLRNYQMVSF